jgi:hypothetical protein
MSTTQKHCFIIGPFGEAGSDTRKRSDQLLKHVIRPSVETLGYTPIRALEISEPGLITTQTINHVLDDPIVVADLSGSNPNVFYELALRHAIRMPLVQLIQKGEMLPFNVAGMRTISFDLSDPDSIEEARADVTEQIRAVEGKKPEELDSPVSIAMKHPRAQVRWPLDLVPLDQLIAIERDAGNQWDHIRLACAHSLWSLWPDRTKHVLENQLGDLRQYVARHAQYLLDHYYV